MVFHIFRRVQEEERYGAERDSFSMYVTNRTLEWADPKNGLGLRSKNQKNRKRQYQKVYVS